MNLCIFRLVPFKHQYYFAATEQTGLHLWYKRKNISRCETKIGAGADLLRHYPQLTL